MVIHRNRKVTLGVILSDHILIQKVFYILRFRQFRLVKSQRTFPGRLLFFYNFIRLLCAFITDGTGYRILTSRLLLPQNVQTSPVLAIDILFIYLSKKTRHKGLVSMFVIYYYGPGSRLPFHKLSLLRQSSSSRDRYRVLPLHKVFLSELK